ncbi:radical SAM protein, partial [bacterium]|nr:radical SAM protein [bacterium]
RARALKRAGCTNVGFGVESGDQEMLDRMKKGTRVEQAERAFEICRETGLVSHAYFIIGLPWETRDSLKKTYELVLRLDPDFFDINVAYPLPGTELHALARAEGLLVDPAGGSYARAALRSYALSAEDLTRWRRRALLRLYMRPRYILRTLARARRAGRLHLYLKAAFQRLRGLLGG